MYKRQVLALAVAEDHVGELVQDELLAVQRRVAAGVEHEVLGVGDQPDRADAVVGIEGGELSLIHISEPTRPY